MYSSDPTTQGQNPFGSMQDLMQMLFGQQQGGGATALPPGATSLYAPQSTTASTLTGSGSDTATNPFSSALGANITQNDNGTVGLASTPATSSPSGSTTTASTDPSAMFSSFQSMIAPYLQQLQTIGQNAQQANTQTQNTLNTNLATTAPVPTPTPGVPQQQAMQDINQAVTTAVNGIGNSESYGSYWSTIQNQLQSMGFTPQMLQALQPRISSGMSGSGDIQDKGGGNTSAFISQDSSSLDSLLNNYYANPPSASAPVGATPPVTQSTPNMASGTALAPATSTGAKTALPTTRANPLSSNFRLA